MGLFECEYFKILIFDLEVYLQFLLVYFDFDYYWGDFVI